MSERKKEERDVRVQKGRTHASSIAVEKAESCAVCTTKLSSSAEPKLLPCLHMMCKACIVNNSEDKHPKECPTCGQSFNLPEVTDCFIFENSAPKCGGCEESVLSGWCKECEEALCSDCVSAHQRVKVTRNHTVIPQEPRSGLSISLRCTSHKQERLKFFCVTCNQLTCRDCQLILTTDTLNQYGPTVYKNPFHSAPAGGKDCLSRMAKDKKFLLLEEAVVSQKDELMKLLDCVREQKNGMRARLQDLDGRLNAIKELKALTQKQLHNVLKSLYASLVIQCRQLSKELEDLCDEEEKSLKVIKTSLKKLEDKQEYITAFIHKILSTEGQCILQHKMQIEKWAQRVLSQKEFVPDTVIQLSLSVNENICHNIKNFASFKATRVPLTAKGKYTGNKPKNAPKEADKRPSGLNSESGATRSISNITSFQATAHSMSQAVSDRPRCGQSESASSEPLQPTQVLTDIIGRTSSSSAPQTNRSNTAQYVVAQVGQHLPQSILPQPSKSQQIFRSLSHPLQSTSLFQSSSFPGTVMPQVVLPQSQSDVVLAAAAAPPGLSSCPSIMVHTASFQSSHFNSLTNTQSHSLASNQSVPSIITSSPLAQSSQAMSNPHPSTMNFSSNHKQQSLSQSRAVSGQSFPSQIAPTKKSLSCTQVVSNTQSVNLQPSQSADTQSADTQSNPLQFTLLKVPNNTASLNSRTDWKFYQYTPVFTADKGTTLIRLPQPTKHIWVRDDKSSHLTLGNMSCPKAPSHTDLPVSSNKKLDPPVSSTPSLPATQIPSVYSNAGQIECATQTIQMPTCELPVKAPADSVCEGDMSVCSRAYPVAEEADSSLPTSTVPEKDTKNSEELSAVHQPRDPHSTTSIKDCSSNQSSLTRSESPLKSISTLSSTGSPSTKYWLTGLPSSFRAILTSEIKVPSEDACSRSTLEHASPPNAKMDDDMTDSDSELVKGMDDAEEEPILIDDKNKTPLVSLHRLAISGSSQSQFRIVPSSQKDEMLLQEIDENQSIQRCLRITAPPAAASPSPSCSSEHFLQADVLDCAVCLSAGASLQCAECARSFHTSCHVPPIIFNPIATWVCSLCQDVLDDTDPFSCNRLKEPYLSLSDQRRCEQLLLTLMCENHSYLLYKTIKQNGGYVKFNLIVGRLLGKRSPPYRSAAEMVSDLWALFDKLSSISKKKDLVVKLQSSFQQRLNVSFGNSLHASLLRPLSSADQTGAPETEPDREKVKNTLKRMREFIAANCTVVAKKAQTE